MRISWLFVIAFMLTMPVSDGAQLALAQGRDGDVEITFSETTGLPNVTPYHGMLLNHRNQVIRPTPENIAIIMRGFAGSVLESGDPATNRAFLSARSNAASLAGEGATAAPLVDSLMVRRLLPRLRAERRGRYETLLRPIEQWAGIAAASRSRQWMNRDAGGLFDVMRALGSDVAPEPPAISYIEECRGQSVPIPPDWGSPEWQLQGRLPFAFAAEPGDVTEVWAYNDPATGSCVALPRRNESANGIRLLGIICQSASTGRACFWDNIDRDTRKQIQGPEAERFPIARLQDGNLIGENCTACHRGANVFLIHPSTPLALRSPFVTDPKVRYSPVSSQPLWRNPPALIEADSSGCGTCHEIPELSASYCGILEQAVRQTMPRMSAPAGWDNPIARFAAHVNIFKEQCAGLR